MAARSRISSGDSPHSNTSPTAASPSRSSLRCGSGGRSSSKARPGVGKTALAGAVAAALDDRSHPTPVLRRSRRHARGVRVGLRAPAAGASHPRGDRDARSRRDARRELYSDAFLIKRPLLQAIDPARSRPAVLLDRRDRSRRRGVRRISARAARGVPDHDTRARHRAREPAAARHPHVESHARGARRAQAALPLSVDRYPDFEKELAIVTARSASRIGAAGRAGDGTRAGAPGHGAVQGARRVRDARLGGCTRRPRPRRARPRRRRKHARRRAQIEGRHRSARAASHWRGCSSEPRTRRMASPREAYVCDPVLARADS